MNHPQFSSHGIARSLTLLIGLSLGAGTGQVVADDTEIFFPEEIIQDDDTVVRPNLLFLMDTSGSMASNDGTGITRLQRMKDALTTVLDSLGANINVGLGRLSGSEGGAILFPAADLDAVASEIDPTLLESIDLSNRPASSNGEAYQNDVTVTLGPTSADNILLVGRATAFGPAETVTVSYSIDSLTNEAEQYTNSSVATGNSRVSDDLEFTQTTDSPPNNRTTRHFGLRFSGITLPEGAEIQDARVVFRCAASNNDNANYSLLIQGHNSGNSAAFSSSDNNISGRAKTASSVNWAPGTRCNDTNTTLQSPDVSAIVKDIVDRPDWSSGNPVTLLFDLPEFNRNNSRRIVTQSFNGDKQPVPPRLDITYTYKPIIPVPSARQQFGLRFENVLIPRGVTLTSARITFLGKPEIDPLATQNGSDLAVQVGVTQSSDPFTATLNAVSGAATGATVTWNIPSMTSGSQEYQTPDLATAIMQRTSQAEWCGGGALNFTFTVPSGAPSGALRAFQSSHTPDNGAVLSFSYSDGDAALDDSCTTASTVRQVTAGDNDASEQINNGSLSVSGNTLSLGKVSGQDQIIGLRFDSLNLPAGSRILAAHVAFTARNNDSGGGVQLTIRGESVGTAAPFATGQHSISNRQQNSGTTASVSWNPGGWSQGSIYETPDLRAIIQEIVDRPDWQNKNALALFLQSNASGSNLRRAHSYENSANNAARLYITAEVPTARLSVREYLKKLVADFPADGNTPIPEFLYEAAQYWRGGPAHFGKTRGDGAVTPDNDSYSPSRNHRISGPATFASPPTIVRPAGCTAEDPNAAACANEKIEGDAYYQSPFSDLACTANAQILLSDGQPNDTQSSSVALIRGSTLLGYANNKSCSQGGGGGGGACATDIASFLYNNDQSSTLDGAQTVQTHTVGLADLSSAEFLRNVASAGGGSFHAANSTEDLVNAFNSIVQRLLDIPTTFVAPAVSVDSFNRLTDRNEIYFAVFRPKLETRWEGNFKRYKIGTGTDGRAAILDMDNVPAVDPTTGFFRETAKSVWSVAPDGDRVSEGGVLDRLTTTRNAYTYTGSSSALDAGGASAPAGDGVSLTETTHRLQTSNNALTKALLEITALSDSDRNNIINYARGIDVYDHDNDSSTSDVRKAMGDPLHSEPALLMYKRDQANPEPTAFVGTNEGGLHAFDAATGDELWFFVPQELLPNLQHYALNNRSYKNRPYGLDGPITTLIRDDDGNHYPFVESGKKIFLYAGMRMGGRQYYALDITARTSPKLKFVIRGGGTGAYREMGETWSKAVPARVRINGQIRSVLVISGGYDRNQDSAHVTTADGMGRALYIVDSNTGERIWWGGINPGGGDAPNLTVAQMRHSVPASPKVIDLDGDGIADRIYIADTGGQIFRFDLKPDNTGAATLATATRIATLAQAGVAEASKTRLDARRFYQTPDLALIAPQGVKPFLTISIGSGYRGHPLSKDTLDRFYVIRDPDVSKTAGSLPLRIEEEGSLTHAHLYDATENAIGSKTEGTAAAAKQTLNDADGFFINLQPSDNVLEGEKVLTDAQTFDNMILFTTYTPAARSLGEKCRASAGVSRFYLFSILDGQPVQNFDQVGADDELTQEDRYFELAQGGLPPTPTILFPSLDGLLPQEAMVCVGAECFNPGFALATEKTYWIKRQ